MSTADFVWWMAVVLFVAWGSLAVRFAPAIWRGYRHTERENDKLRGFIFFVALLQLAFAGRRLSAPNDDASLIGLFILSAMCAGVGVLVLRGYDRAA